jgi:hypothetical protein
MPRAIYSIPFQVLNILVCSCSSTSHTLLTQLLQPGGSRMSGGVAHPVAGNWPANGVHTDFNTN